MNLPTPIHKIDINISEKRPLGGLNPYNPNYDKIGNAFCKLLIEHAHLNSKSKILDVGCGTGRLANPVLQLLDSGQYYGFDVNSKYINYCKQRWKEYDGHFIHADIQHDEYNPNGAFDIMDYKFEYPDNSFDIAASIAVFNHFETRWVFRYIAEMTRVLKPKGILIATFLILNSLSMQNIEASSSTGFHFEYKSLDSWHKFKDRRLVNVAIPESGLRQQCIKCKLMIKEPIRYGEWCGSSLAITGHDVLIAIKGQWR